MIANAWARRGEILRAIASLVDRGALAPMPDPRRFTLASVAAAHELAASGTASGKVVVEVS